MSGDLLFDRALAVVLEHEGFDRFTDDPRDPGGATKWGISLRTLARLEDGDGDGWLDGDLDHDGDVDADDVRAMTRDQAAAIYHGQFWARYGYGRLIAPAMAIKAFDLAVNMGPGAAHILLQRAARACDRPVAVDGILGPASLAALNESPPRCILAAFRSEAAGYYRVLVARKPSRQWALNGWLNRAYS